MNDRARGSRDDREVLSALALRGRPGPLRERIALVKELGSLHAALCATGVPGSILRRAERDRDAVEAAGFELVCWSQERYPRLLRMTHDPPLLLTVWGELKAEDALAVAVVGSRRATRYGLELARELARDLSALGLVIVSGLARGIDQAAHRGALEAGGRTIAVLGSGLRRIYPREHRELAARIARRGAVVSEHDLDANPLASHFPRRNRIITGMTLGTLVVEAARKSGSLISARLAMEEDREVFAVPGPARAPNSEGVHALIRDGAKLVTSAADVVEELRPEIRALLRPPGSHAPATPRPRAPEGLAGEVYRLVRDAGRPLHLDAILERVPAPTARILAVLGELELSGLAWRLPGGLYQATPT